MVKNLDDMQKIGKENVDVTMKSLGACSRNAQVIAAELADYSKDTFEEGTKTLERLLGAKSIDKVIEIQTEYAKSSYANFIAQATKIGELYTDLAKETFKPFESYVAKVSPGK
jgi:hypothetical protein